MPHLGFDLSLREFVKRRNPCLAVIGPMGFVHQVQPCRMCDRNGAEDNQKGCGQPVLMGWLESSVGLEEIQVGHVGSVLVRNVLARQHASACQRQEGPGTAVPLRSAALWHWSACRERRT